MGCTGREKHIRASRRPKQVAKQTQPHPGGIPAPITKSMQESGVDSQSCHLGMQNPACSPNTDADFYGNGGRYCTEEHLEEILLKNLEDLYKEALSRLVGMGYDEEAALEAILKNGLCYGGMDVLANIVENSWAYLNGSSESVHVTLDGSEVVFSDLRQLVEYSLAGIICLMQQVRPHLSKRDAMWCLVMGDLHVGIASRMEIPVDNSPGNESGNALTRNSLESASSNVVDHGIGMVAPPLRFHGGWGFGSGGVGLEPAVNELFSCAAEMTVPRNIDCPKRFNLSPSMKSLLKRNVAMFAAGFRAQMHMQPQACMSVWPSGNAAPTVAGSEVSVNNGDDAQNLKNQDGVNSMLRKFHDLNLDENVEPASEDEKDVMIETLLHQIKDLEGQVKERREWAHEKAIQAARKLSSDLTEIRMLRTEREVNQRLKEGKPILEDSTLRRLSAMENALRKASSQVDRANAAVRRLENENAEIRAEMEASKLSASESARTSLEVAKREKKYLKKLVAWEKQKTKLQDEIAEEKEKTKELHKCLALIKQAEKEYEEKWRQEIKAQEQALAQVKEARQAKEATEVSNKRQFEALRLKTELDFQRHKDDLQRLEQEFSRLKFYAESTELNQQSTASPLAKTEGAKPQGGKIDRLVHELDRLTDSSDCGRKCIICMKDEVSIVFLPCAHEVLCATCNDNYGKKGKATCPCCRAPIEERIRVFGASS